VTTTRRFADLSQCDLVKPLQHRFYLPAPYERYGADVQGPCSRPPSRPPVDHDTPPAVCAVAAVLSGGRSWLEPRGFLSVAVDTTEFTSRCMDGGSATHWRLTEGGHFLPRDTSRALWARTVGWLVSHQRRRTIADDRRQRDIDLRAEIQVSSRGCPAGSVLSLRLGCVCSDRAAQLSLSLNE
jgi:hypothetical protein